MCTDKDLDFACEVLAAYTKAHPNTVDDKYCDLVMAITRMTMAQRGWLYDQDEGLFFHV